MTAQEVKDFIRTQLVAKRTIAQEYSAFDSVIDFISQSITTGIPSWSAGITFNNNGTGSGAFCTFADTDGRLRFWKSKTNANIGNSPPSSPLVITNTYWDEVSPSSGSAIKEWASGIYGTGLVIVYFDTSGSGANPALYILKEPTRPFNSTNIVTEISAGKWAQLNPPGQIAISSVTTSGSIITLDMLLAAQVFLKGATNISAAKTWQKAGAGNARKIDFFFNITGQFAQTIDFGAELVRVVATRVPGTWNNATQAWTPDYAGDYQATLYYEGTKWNLIIEGPYQ